MDTREILTGVLALADGEVVGRVRLQKMFYLLDELGLSSGLSYTYHHFGPYSDELSDELMYAMFNDDVEELTRTRFSDGARYSVFSLSAEVAPPTDKVGSLAVDVAGPLVQKLKKENATVLELASTIHWLKHHEGYAEWEDELRARKGNKVTADRKERACRLLEEIGLGV